MYTISSARMCAFNSFLTAVSTHREGTSLRGLRPIAIRCRRGVCARVGDLFQVAAIC